MRRRICRRESSKTAQTRSSTATSRVGIPFIRSSFLPHLFSLSPFFITSTHSTHFIGQYTVKHRQSKTQLLRLTSAFRRVCRALFLHSNQNSSPRHSGIGSVFNVQSWILWTSQLVSVHMQRVLIRSALRAVFSPCYLLSGLLPLE